jgi:hypothetical protein
MKDVSSGMSLACLNSSPDVALAPWDRRSMSDMGAGEGEWPEGVLSRLQINVRIQLYNIVNYLIQLMIDGIQLLCRLMQYSHCIIYILYAINQ